MDQNHGELQLLSEPSPLTSDTLADHLFSQYPGPVIINQSSDGVASQLLVCTLFAIVGLLIGCTGTFAGWFVFLFFGLGSLILWAVVIPGLSTLTLDADGFEQKLLFFRARTRWLEAINFRVGEMASPGGRVYKRVWYNSSRWDNWKIVKWGSAIGIGNAMVMNVTGVSAVDLARIMTQWQTRAVAMDKR